MKTLNVLSTTSLALALGLSLSFGISPEATAKNKSKNHAHKMHARVVKVNHQDSEAIAVEAYRLYDKGLELSGLEKLFTINDPSQISPKTATLWRAIAPKNSPVWRQVHVKFTPAWGKIFSPETASVIQAWQVNSMKSESDFSKATELNARLSDSSNEKAWLAWQSALNRALQNQSAKAIPELQKLLDSDQKLVSQDEILMTTARVLYQDNKFEGAIRFYERVSNASDFWLDSLEEQAWAYVRLNDYEKALGKYNTLMTPAFAPQVGPEAYLIGSFSNLKVCDYNGVFDALKNFRSKYKTLIPELESLAKSGNSQAVDRALSKLSKGPTSWASLGADVEKLPQFLNRDVQLLKALDKKNYYLIEATRAQSLGKTKIAANSFQRSESAQSDITARIKVLAQRDLNILSKIVQKLHIVEVEAIQRMEIPQKSAVKLTSDTKKSLRDEVKFPKESEVWLDEVSHYQVKAKGCKLPGGTRL
jgi:tetratricopeptide (TPR) repeat protein